MLINLDLSQTTDSIEDDDEVDQDTPNRHKVDHRKLRRHFSVCRNWFRKNRHRFTIAPLPLVAHKNCLLLRFPNLNPSIQLYITPHSFDVPVYWDAPPVSSQRRFVDLLVSLDREWAEKRSDGWHCRCCLEEYERAYPTRHALTTAHFFEELLEWCNDQLFPAQAIRLAILNGFSYAKIVNDPPQLGAISSAPPPPTRTETDEEERVCIISVWINN